MEPTPLAVVLYRSSSAGDRVFAANLCAKAKAQHEAGKLAFAVDMLAADSDAVRPLHERSRYARLQLPALVPVGRVPGLPVPLVGDALRRLALGLTQRVQGGPADPAAPVAPAPAAQDRPVRGGAKDVAAAPSVPAGIASVFGRDHDERAAMPDRAGSVSEPLPPGVEFGDECGSDCFSSPIG